MPGQPRTISKDIRSKEHPSIHIFTSGAFPCPLPVVGFSPRPPLATKGERDFRRILEDRSIDAISIATPNHWHSLMTILAAQAGKHVYVEKPISHDVVEGRVAVAAQKKYGVVVQHGTQRRSNDGIAGRFLWNDQGETPNTMFAMAEYPNGQIVLFNVRNVNYEGYKSQVCNEYYLEDGSVITGEGKYKIRRPGSDQAEDLKLPPGKVTPGGNWQSFMTAVRAGDPGLANGNVLDAHYGCVLGHLMNNSYRLGTEAPFDAKAGRFGDRADVAEHFGKLHAIMRDGVGIPADGATTRCASCQSAPSSGRSWPTRSSGPRQERPLTCPRPPRQP